MIGTHALHNGVLIPIEKATLPIDSVELMYGFGVYETVKLRNGRLFFIQDHVERLFHSASLIGINHPFTKTQVSQWIHDLIEKNDIASTNIKIILLGGDHPDLFMFMANPLYVEKKDYRDGLHAITVELERFMPQAKSLNMLGSYVAYTKAKEHNAFDAILIDRNGNALEGTRSNLFFIKDTHLYTAPVNHVLDGVTRKTVIDCATQHGYALTEQLVHRDTMMQFDGAFLTNTSGKIVPLKSIDDSSYTTITPALTTLRNYYTDYLATL